MADTLKVDAALGDASAPSADDPASRVGTLIASKYALERLLGAGGMGAVYEAENTWTGRRVALKVMLPSALKVASAAERFLREARAASKVQHPNIVEVFDAGQNPSDGALYIVQELLRGSDLRARLDDASKLSWSETMSVMGPVLDALSVAHRQGVVHRDIKPENIYLADTAAGRVPKLIDFGIARLVDGDAPLSLTRSGALMGTPYYMSPEQARGLREVDARADVWALAIVMREALTGRRPFEGSNYNALLASILQDPIPSLGELAGDVPPHAVRALDRALSRDPDQRFADAGELLDALRSVPLDALAQTAPGTAIERPLRHRKRTLGAVFVAGACVATLALSTRRPSPVTAPPDASRAVLSASISNDAPTERAIPVAPAVIDAAVVAVAPAVNDASAPRAERPRVVRRAARHVADAATPLIRSLTGQ